MEEKEIKIIEDFNYNFLTATRLKRDMPVTMYINDEINDTIMKLLQAYKKDEKVIQEMADFIAYKTDNTDYKHSVIDYFRKKCE